MSDKLKPCPFCGAANSDDPLDPQPLGVEKTGTVKMDDQTSEVWEAGCLDGCCANVPDFSEAAAIAAWNRRYLERLSCYRCGNKLKVYGRPDNPSMEVCPKCHEAILEGLRPSPWVPVGERSPKVMVSILLCGGYYIDPGVGWLHKDGVWCNEEGKALSSPPTHWMPLPAPPDKED